MTINADMILTCSNIFKGKEFEKTSGFVAVKENKIIAVEKDMNKIPDYKSEGTKIIDCGDGFVMPGFHDCHVHIIQGGIFKNGVNLDDCKSEEEAAKRVREYAEKNPNLPWILGCGWYHIYWDNKEYPTRKSLDKYVKDRPVFLENEDGHGAWVNTKALEMCNIDSETPDPDFGKIFRDEDGNPTGYLDELAMVLCGAEAYSMPKDMENELLNDFISEAVKNGVTSVNDMRPFFTVDLGNLENYEALDNNGEQPIRINFTSNLFDDLDKAKALREKYEGGKLHYMGLKQFIDGVAISYTSLLKDDYSDNSGCKGGMLVTKSQLDDAVCAAHGEGMQVHLHVTGDAAVDLSLDAFEKAIEKTGIKGIRHSLEHIDLISPEDIPRIKASDTVASMQPEHMAPTEKFEDNPYPVRFGSERTQYAWAIGSIMNSGATVAFGTDYPVADLNPLNGIYRAVTRRSDDGLPKDGWNAEERISIADALDAYTLGSAKMALREDDIGTLEAGKYADITILDRDPFDVDVEEITSIKIKYTICDGKIVYSS